MKALIFSYYRVEREGGFFFFKKDIKKIEKWGRVRAE